MTKISKRKQRMLLREFRIAILDDIRKLNRNRCINCRGQGRDNASTHYYKCGCQASRQILKLGDQLLKLVAERQVIVDDTPKPAIPIINIKNLKLEDLTVEIYENMKLRGMTEEQIMRHLKVGFARLNKWKIENGLGKRTNIVEGIK